MPGPGSPEPPLALEILAEPLALCQMDPGAPLPGWLGGGDATDSLVSVSRTSEELSIVCPERLVPDPVPHEAGRRALRVAGTLDHSLTGVLVALAAPLAAAGVPIFAISTWDTDYLLVAGGDLDRAVAALTGVGHSVGGSRGD